MIGGAASPWAERISQVAVIGAGTMGTQIALQFALHGFSVALTDTSEEQLARAAAAHRGHLQRRVERDQLTADAMTQALARIQTTADLGAAVQHAGFVIEAIIEDLAAKQAVFRELDARCPPDVLLASNSSSIVISDIVAGVAHPERAVNMHFFHPALVLKLVEVVRGRFTSAEAAAAAMALAHRIGKEPVLLTREISGFIVNRLLFALWDEAMRLAEEGYATPEDIDRAVKLGLNHPMGPFELADFSGLDIVYNARLHAYEQTGNLADKPPAILAAKVNAGHLGRKTGRGFYDYPPGRR